MLIIKLFNIIIFFFLLTPLPLLCQERYEAHQQKMGTQFRIIIYSSHKISAQNSINQSFKKVDALNNIFSDYDADSEISQLSASAGEGQKIKVSWELWKILKLAKKYSKKSKGAFDISIGPLSKLWRSMIRKKEIFNGVKINSAKNKVGFQKIRLYPLSKRVKLVQKDMRLDLGGIAKGFTVDEIVKLLRKNGFTQFLVDGGGDIYVGAAPPQKHGWQVNIKVLNGMGDLETHTLLLTNTAIASSGDTFRFLDWNGKRYSHIVDPRTGYGVIDQKIINVQAPSCTQADVVASTLSVLNKTEAISFLKKMKKIKVY